ncbi:unnamed protein product [Angiostrongylus costaricensis]|uniref:Gly-zipper_Omp domain-containing protein n=1 Tax=Angiostrongylus costaricensis TaxID=334426 RepID=A0A0R3PY23_ANGCS|nr:unnamed protein product [Angiostrongylus costaricensis]
MSILYFREVFKVIEKSQSLRQTFVGVAKQTGWTALGTVAGGLLVGPLGALVGGVIGAACGYNYSSDYDVSFCWTRFCFLWCLLYLRWKWL